MENNLAVQHFFDKDTSTLTYIVYDRTTRDALAIDPVLDLDIPSGQFSLIALTPVIEFIQHHQLNLWAILETHAHADHTTGAQYLKEKFPKAKIGIGKNIVKVQESFKKLLNLEGVDTAGKDFDLLLEDQQTYRFGSITLKAFSTPGHTPACSTYCLSNPPSAAQYLFSGDALFMPDSGTGRCDFPLGSATDLYHSVHDLIYSFPNETKIFVGHDYQPGGRPLLFQTTVGEEKENNTQLKASTSAKDFIEMRTNRDKTLKVPRLLYPSIQINIRGGHLPSPEDNQTSYIKLPIKGP